jgi:superfamily II DNA or RNA helicase
MCGLYVKEMILRGDLDRCLVVAPGGLVDQWHDELWTKFGLQFRILSRDLMASTPSGSVFQEFPLLIARMDMLARNEDLQAQLGRSEWDLVVVDEAHRMSARWDGSDLEPTKRYGLGRRLGKLTRNLLLMTATPHKGDPSAFQAFLALLDEDRFAGQPRGSVKPPGTDIMRRMLKEELLTMDGKPLFPERRASTVRYELSSQERHLYDQVSDYVRNEMNRAKRIQSAGDRKRATTVGFALTVLQRRLASSPEAILRSLERRRTRLQRLRDELNELAEAPVPTPAEMNHLTMPDDMDDGWSETEPGREEEIEETLVDAASAARTRVELDLEIAALDGLVSVAAEVRSRETDSKWTELRSILQDHEMTRDSAGNPRKIIIFSEHRDTLRYLAERIRRLPGRGNGVVEIHGGLGRDDRVAIQRRFTDEPGTSVLVATDAAGEGLNLQCAHLMVNYDLPWNPNRIEQRFGRIHRIGQTEMCHLWNLVAEGTREGDVFLRLLNKMAEQARAYQGKVFDVLGEAFEGTPLRDLLVEAILRGDDPAVRKRLNTVIDAAVREGIPELVQRRAMYQQVLHQVDVQDAQEKVDLGARSKLQPHFVSSWFETSFKAAGGRIRRRSDGLAEIPFVPEAVVAAGRRHGGAAVANRYERVTFDPARVQVHGHAGAQVIGPGHPLLDALAEIADGRAGAALREGSILVDPHDRGTSLRLFSAVWHEITNGHSSPRTLSRHIAFVEIDQDGHGCVVGPTYLDYRPIEDDERPRALALLSQTGLGVDLDNSALGWALRELVPSHVEYVRTTHATAVERARDEITERLGSELRYWRGRRNHPGSASEPVARRIERVEARLAQRLKELDSDARVVSRPPRVLGCALVVPIGALDLAHAMPDLQSGAAALEAVADAERHLGRMPELVGSPTRPALRSRAENGVSVWIDVRLHDPAERHIVMGRTDVLHAKNLGDRYRLALVGPPIRNGAAEVRYVRDPFSRIRTDDFHQHQFELVAGASWRSGQAPF